MINHVTTRAIKKSRSYALENIASLVPYDRSHDIPEPCTSYVTGPTTIGPRAYSHRETYEYSTSNSSTGTGKHW